MSFDSSRFTFNPWNDFSGVVMQQGRVQLDSEWNEWLAELARRIQAGTYDTLGQAVYPATTPDAFKIALAGNSITIGVGRMYVDGLLVENHGLTAPAFQGWVPTSTTNPGGTNATWDPALAELFINTPVDYASQPYYPNVSVVAPFPTSGGPYLIYLDVWQRELTFLEDPDLIEKAVGIDTTGRLQTVWQVKWLPVSNNVTCSTPSTALNWPPLPPSAGRLTTGVVQSSPSGPCCLTPNTGFTGLENQLYRVEIHQSSPATFKWSRDDASVATAVTAISPDNTVLTVQSTGKDNVLRFAVNDWVEIADDWLELNGRAGELHQVKDVDNTAQTITLTMAVTGSFAPSDPTRHTRAIRWNGANINVPAPGTTATLEDGITVAFDLVPNTGSFNVGDFWTFAARTADGTVESLVDAPPRGVHHHYARLAVLTFPLSTSNPPSDCRVPWPPSGGGCDCASCVTPDSHNNNTWTIQDAINAVQAKGGGKVCLGPGNYDITTTITVQIDSQGNYAANITISGHGLPILVPAGVSGSIMLIQGAIDIVVEGVGFAAGAGTGSSPATPLIGLIISDSSYVRVENCLFGLATDTAPFSPAIGLAGAVLNSTIRESLFFNVAMAVALTASPAPEAPAPSDGYLLSQIEIEENQVYCLDGGVFLSNPNSLLLYDISFCRNFVQGSSGFVLVGIGLDVTVQDNTFAIAAATPSTGALLPYDAAVVCNCSQTRVANNRISGITIPLSATAASGQGPLKGTYTWVVTALDAAGREILVSAPATLSVTGTDVQLSWALVVGVVSYNAYRTAANSSNLQLDGNVPQGSGPTITYTDSVPDSGLTGQFPTLQNDGIVLGSPFSGSIVAGSQITGNQISNLVGTGIVSLADTVSTATLIGQNQIANLAANGIRLAGGAVDLEITENLIANIAQLPAGSPFGIWLGGAVIDADLSGNNIENVGPQTDRVSGSCSGTKLLLADDVRIAGNRIVNLAPATALTAGIVAALGPGRCDIADNEVRRLASPATPPAQPDESIWLALFLSGGTVSVQGNSFESFGGAGRLPGTALVETDQPCTFSNNQCFLDDPPRGKQFIVVGIKAQSIILMGNLVRGPVTQEQPSVDLTLLSANPALLTAVGNITSAGIHAMGAPLPNPWAPLNITG